MFLQTNIVTLLDTHIFGLSAAKARFSSKEAILHSSVNPNSFNILANIIRACNSFNRYWKLELIMHQAGALAKVGINQTSSRVATFSGLLSG